MDTAPRHDRNLPLRIFITIYMLKWFFVLGLLYQLLKKYGADLARAYHATDMALPGFTRYFSLAVTRFTTNSVVEAVIHTAVWSILLGMPLITIIFAWRWKDHQRLQSWFIYTALSELSLVVATGMLTYIGNQLPVWLMLEPFGH